MFKIPHFQFLFVCMYYISWYLEIMYLPIGDSKSFDTSIDGQNVSYMAIVEPEPRRTNLKNKSFKYDPACSLPLLYYHVIVLNSFLLPILPNYLCDHSSKIYRKISPYLLAWTETTRISQLAAAHILPPSWFYEYRKVSWVTICYEAWCAAWCERLLLIFSVRFSEICRKLNMRWH